MEKPELDQPLAKDDKLESAAPAIESPETEQPGKLSTIEEPNPHTMETPEMEQPHQTDEKAEPAAPRMAAPDMEQPPEIENKSESAVPGKVNSEIEPHSEADDKTETSAPTKAIHASVQADEVGQNILYIEDNPDNMLLVKRALESRGYTLYQAENGLDGVSIAENYNIDLILLDINLPDIDGYEVARRLRKSGKPQLAYIPIIAITANALKGDAELSLQAGCDVYMSKPVNIRELWARIEAYVPSVV